jgi:membrane fusion protein, multidrug efflux system
MTRLHSLTPTLRPTVYLAAAALPLLAACRDTPKEAPELQAPPVPVTIASVGESDTSARVTATGTFVSRDEIPLGFKIGGVVTRVLVDEGATVQRGQILASLDLREIDAAVAKAQVAVDKAQRDHARLQRLAADSVATLAQLQDATSALDAARADHRTAQVNRDYAVITAPEGGVVMRRHVTPGSTVAPGTTVLLLGGSNRGRVLRAGLPDRDALRVRVGDKATVRFDAMDGRTFSGRVIVVGQAADSRTGTFTVEVAIADADALPTGLVGRVEIGVRGAAVASAVPVDALLEAHGDSATVYTVHAAPGGTPGVLVATPVRVMITAVNGDRATIRGLDDDARVVARGAAYVRPGAVVREVTSATLDSAARSDIAPHRGLRTPALASANGERVP